MANVKKNTVRERQKPKEENLDQMVDLPPPLVHSERASVSNSNANAPKSPKHRPGHLNLKKMSPRQKGSQQDTNSLATRSKLGGTMASNRESARLSQQLKCPRPVDGILPVQIVSCKWYSSLILLFCSLQRKSRKFRSWSPTCLSLSRLIGPGEEKSGEWVAVLPSPSRRQRPQENGTSIVVAVGQRIPRRARASLLMDEYRLATIPALILRGSRTF